MTTIVGAGLAGLIAGHLFPKAEILERGQPVENHKALLRFRSDTIANVTGIDFKPVTVRKGIYYGRHFHAPDIGLANMYSRKVLAGQLQDRSIWNLDSVTRWIAPETFYEQLVDQMGKRVTWGFPVDLTDTKSPTISTIPLPIALQHCGIEHDATFRRAAISVKRFRLKRSNVNQTIYYPDSNHSMYRASITGDLLIVEFIGKPNGPWARELLHSFCINGEWDELGDVEQRYGKITPIDNGDRRALISTLTMSKYIYSLGRFATWRNILLDDVVHDALVIKELMKASTYEHKMRAR